MMNVQEVLSLVRRSIPRYWRLRRYEQMPIREKLMLTHCPDCGAELINIRDHEAGMQWKKRPGLYCPNGHVNLTYILEDHFWENLARWKEENPDWQPPTREEDPEYWRLFDKWNDEIDRKIREEDPAY